MAGSKSGTYILGPTLEDLSGIGLRADVLYLATGTYSCRALESLDAEPKALRLMFRLDLGSTDDWINGLIDPEALLAFVQRMSASGAEVHMFISPHAHAKAYVGSDCGMIGSANLTLRGFGGGPEMVLLLREPPDIRHLQRALDDYASMLTPLRLQHLHAYVDANAALVRREKAKQPPGVNLDTLPRTRTVSARRLGDYDAFLLWLGEQPSPAAKEILARARGKAALSGHIHRNFYGLRQFLIAYPEAARHFRRVAPDGYSLARDPDTERQVANFVRNYATDEPDFVLRYWKTYLPVECGGRAPKHGGTIGNLNRMLPLVARFIGR